MSRPTRVLIIDDSAVVRRQLTEQLSRQPGIEVVGSAPDPYAGRDMIVELEPDALTLDIEMPRMDGLTFLRKLMKFHPMPVVVVSSVTPKGCDTAVACLEAGAIAVLAKPSQAYSIGDFSTELGALLRDAKNVTLSKRITSPVDSGRERLAGAARIETTNKIIAIGASTGGTDAIARVLAPLPARSPGIVTALHMPPGFTNSFAKRLDDMCQIEVREAQDRDAVVNGLALIAPGDKHLKLERDGARYIVRVVDGPRVLRHRPSVEVLFESVAESAGANAMGAILTGMGDDGGGGLKAMRDAGAYTVAQDENTCVVFGMPKVAISKGGVCDVLPLDDIPPRMLKFAAGQQKAA